MTVIPELEGRGGWIPGAQTLWLVPNQHHLWIVLLGITVESDNALRLHEVSAVLDAV